VTPPRFNHGRGDDYRGLCEAMVGVSAAKGYHELTVRDVEKAAGLEPGSFERVFPNLEACLVAVWDAISAELLVLEEAAFGGSAPWRDRIRTVLEVQIEYFVEYPELARLYLAESLFCGEMMKRRRGVAISRLARMIDAGQGERDADDDRFEGAEAVAGGVWGQMVQAVRAGEPKRLKEELPELMYLVVLPYLGRGAARRELGSAER
jgi:AcrR family transcriptional regulator